MTTILLFYKIIGWWEINLAILFPSLSGYLTDMLDFLDFLISTFVYSIQFAYLTYATKHL